MAEAGRMGWQRATGYGRRNHVEVTMGRYKHLIGSRLRAHAARPARRGGNRRGRGIGNLFDAMLILAV